MADTEIIDLCTRFGPVPPRAAAPGTDRLRTLLTRHGVDAAVTLSTRALYFDAVSGNQETGEACASDAEGPRLFAAAALDPRLPDSGVNAAARLICLFPVTQRWPSDYAPLAALLRPLASRPLLWEAGQPGAATAAVRTLRAAEHTAPVILAGITGETLTEALTAASAAPQIQIATEGLGGVGQIAAVVQALGAERVLFGSGAPAFSLGAALAAVRRAALSPSDQALVLGGNARRILGL